MGRHNPVLQLCESHVSGVDSPARFSPPATRPGTRVLPHLHHGHLGAGAGALVLALAGDPAAQRLELLAQGLDLQGGRGCARGRAGRVTVLRRLGGGGEGGIAVMNGVPNAAKSDTYWPRGLAGTLRSGTAWTVSARRCFRPAASRLLLQRSLPKPTHLADAAALVVAVLVEGEQPLGAHQVHHLLRLREGVLDLDAVVLLHLVEQAVGLGVQAASVQAGGEGEQIGGRKTDGGRGGKGVGFQVPEVAAGKGEGGGTLVDCSAEPACASSNASCCMGHAPLQPVAPGALPLAGCVRPLPFPNPVSTTPRTALQLCPPEDAVGAAGQVGVLDEGNILCTAEGNSNVAAEGLQGLLQLEGSTV